MGAGNLNQVNRQGCRLGEARHPAPCIRVAADGRDSGQDLEGVEDVGRVDVPRVYDPLGPSEGLDRFGAQETVGIGDEADDVSGHQESLRAGTAPRTPPLAGGRQTCELPRQRGDLDEVGTDVVRAALLAGCQAEAPGRIGGPCAGAAQMDHGGEILLLLEAGPRAARTR